MEGSMPDESINAEVTEQQQTEEVQQEEAAQPETDWKAEARKWEKRAKENREAAEKAAEAAEEVERANARIRELETENERREWLETVCTETKVPLDVLKMLKADDLESLRAGAAAIASHYAHPVIPDSGEPKKAAVTRESILAIKNEKERLAAIRENAELFQ